MLRGNTFVYSCSIKICALGFSELLESIFCHLIVVEAFSLLKVVEILQEVVVNWQSQMNMVGETNLRSNSFNFQSIDYVMCGQVFCGEELGPHCWPMPLREC